MMGKRMLAGAGLVMALVICGYGPAGWAAQQPAAQNPPQAAPQAAPQEKQAYTMAEYNAYQAAANEKNAQQRIKLLDDFVSKYANSTLLPHIYRLHYTTYNELKNFAKTIEYADRLLTFGDKIDAGTRLEALYVRALAFHGSFNDKDPSAREQATRAREAALKGLEVLGQLQKPEGMTDEQFAQNKKAPQALFNYTAGFASLQAKDYKAAVESFKAALAVNPTDAVTYFRLGVAYLQTEPPAEMNGFWALARSVALKGPGEAQVRSYLRNQLLRYQQTACDKLIDSQMNELITLAANSAEPPATYKIPSAAELTKVRETGAANFIEDLKTAGEQSKLIWLAMCGLEFPDVPVKVMAVTPGNESVVLKVFRAPTQEAMEAATEPNMNVKVEGQPEAQRIQKGDYVRFTGTLVGYDQNPFMLHWEKAKVNKEDIPEAKAQPAKKPTKRPPKRPTKRPSR